MLVLLYISMLALPHRPSLPPLSRLLIRPITSLIDYSPTPPSHRLPSVIRSIRFPIPWIPSKDREVLSDLLWKTEGIRYAYIHRSRSNDNNRLSRTEPLQSLLIRKPHPDFLNLVFFTPELARSATQDLLPRLAAMNLHIVHCVDFRQTRDDRRPSDKLVIHLDRKTDGPAIADSLNKLPGVIKWVLRGWNAYVQFDSVEAASAAKATHTSQSCVYAFPGFEVEASPISKLRRTLDARDATHAFQVHGTGNLLGTWKPLQAIISDTPGLREISVCEWGLYSLVSLHVYRSKILTVLTDRFLDGSATNTAQLTFDDPQNALTAAKKLDRHPFPFSPSGQLVFNTFCNPRPPHKEGDSSMLHIQSAWETS